MSRDDWTEAEIREIAREGGRGAAIELFRNFGVDPDNQQEVNKFRDGVMTAYRLRRYAGFVVFGFLVALGSGAVAILTGL